MPDPACTPPLPASFDRPDLAAAGFMGWLTWDALRANDFASVPCQPGAYVVFRSSPRPPSMVQTSPGGWFKGQDPSVPAQRLQSEWVPGAHVVYIGKADFRKRRKRVEALRERLGEFGRFGAGEPVAHWGGRLIWQLADSGELLVAWHATVEEVAPPGVAPVLPPRAGMSRLPASGGISTSVPLLTTLSIWSSCQSPGQRPRLRGLHRH